MGKIKKKFNKLNSVEAYDCLCINSLASCSCAGACACVSVKPTTASNYNAAWQAIYTNTSAHKTYQTQNRAS